MKRDIDEAITERFIEQLKRGTVPWQKPWFAVQNIVSRKPYRGINALLLGSADYQSPFWISFKQALDLGGHVKKGEKSTPVIYYKILEKRDEAGNLMVREDGRSSRIPFVRWANVFNLDQTEGIQAPAITTSQSVTQPHERAAAIVENAKLCSIHHAGFAAYYSLEDDIIRIPAPSTFHSQEGYYHTLYHEMTHLCGEFGYVVSFVVCLLWKQLERQHNICIANLIFVADAAVRERGIFMFERFFCEPRCLRRYREGAMKAEREEFLRHIVAEGRSDCTIRQIMRDTLIAAEMLTQKDTEPVVCDDLQWLEEHWINALPNRRGDARALRERRIIFLGHARMWLRFIGRFKEKAPVQPFGEELERFIEFGRRERGLASATCKYQRRVASEFFNWFASNVGDDLSKLQITHVLSFAQQASFARKSRTYAVGSIGSLRVLLRWMVQRGQCSKALVNCVQAPRLYHLERYPVGPAWSEVQELVASTAGDSIQDLRDRAILLLLAIYGLRVGEIRSLRLEDIDWENETIRPPRPKQRKVGIYPLTREVGDAIIAYLRVRPQCRYRQLFITLRQPYLSLSGYAVTSIVKNRQRRLGHKPKRYGAHGLRHACATYLLSEGFTLKQIGDHLGHTMIRATEAYAKVDLQSLRQVGDYSLADLIDCDAECGARETPFHPIGSREALWLVADVSLREIL